jgi:DNA polymerase-3 subunit epsilon
MLASAATFVVTDLETTGVTPDKGARILEIGAVKVRGGEIVDRFQTLVNPGVVVPRRITELTGISTAAVIDAPRIEDVLPDYLAFLGDGVFVAHNVPFDARFVAAEAIGMGLRPPRNPRLCTLRLARRILTGLRSKGLGSVASHYGIPINGRHRAMGDAEATAHVLLRFLSYLAYQDLTSLDDVLAFQNRRYSKGSSAPRYLTKLREAAGALPERPGVYFMRDANKNVVYVGKALNLRSRVRSYFTAIEAHPPRLRRLVETVRSIAHEETGSELSALLLESRLIKELQPKFNRASRRYRNRPFLRLDTSHRLPRVDWTPYILDDGAEYYGPLGGRKQAEAVIEVIDRFFELRACDDATLARGHRCFYHEVGRCLGPCVGGLDEAYAHEVDRVRAFVTGRDADVLDRLKSAMQQAAAAREYELAGQYRDWLLSLQRMTGKRRSVAQSVMDHHAVVVQPGAGEVGRQVFVVRYGRHVETLTLGTHPSPDDAERLRVFLEQHFADEPPRPERYLRREIDEVRVLAHWLYVHRESARHVPFEPGTPVEALAARVEEALRFDVEEVEEEEALLD